MSAEELFIMSVSKKQRFLKLMRMETVSPSDIDREKLGDARPKELLARLSFTEFTRLMEEIRADRSRAPRVNPSSS